MTRNKSSMAALDTVLSCPAVGGDNDRTGGMRSLTMPSFAFSKCLSSLKNFG